MLNLNRWAFVIALFSLCLSQAFAQGKTGQATITLSGNDYRSGNVQIVPDEQDRIKLTDGTQSEYIPVKEIKIIRFNDGVKYVSVLHRPAKQKPYKVLARVLMQSSKLSLYKRNTELGKSFYVSDGDSTYQLKSTYEDVKLEAGDHRNVGTSGRFRKYKKEYVKVLMVLMSDEPRVFNLIQKTELTEESLLRLLQAYSKGEVQYSANSLVEIDAPANWVLYGQGGTLGSYSLLSALFPSYDVEVGGMLYTKSTNKLAFKAGLNYTSGKFIADRENYDARRDDLESDKLMAIDLSLHYDYVRKEKYTLYVDFLALSVVSGVLEETNSSGVFFLPRFSPSLGAGFNLGKRGMLYFELNHLFRVMDMPRSISVGYSYDLGKVTRM